MAEYPESKDTNHYNQPIEVGSVKSAIDLKHEILSYLFQLSRSSILNDICASLTGEECTDKEHKSLAFIKTKLNLFESIYPEDKDVPILKILFEDAEEAILASTEAQKVRLGRKIPDVLAYATGLVESAKLREVNLKSGQRIPSEFPKLTSEVMKLKSMGITPSYVVMPQIKNAPTVVLFAGKHVQYGSDAARRSSRYIGKSIKSAITNGFVRDIYIEGYKAHRELRARDFEGMMDSELDADEKIAREFVHNVKFKGVETPHLFEHFDDYVAEYVDANFDKLDILMRKMGLRRHEDAMFRSKDPQVDKIIFLRGVFENIFIAMNVKDSIIKSQQSLSFQVIGRGHEMGGAGVAFTGIIKNPLPMSKLLAAYGLNVIVVDPLNT